MIVGQELSEILQMKETPVKTKVDESGNLATIVDGIRCGLFHQEISIYPHQINLFVGL